MMEFNNTINRILLEYSESLNWKHLNLRTYSVICLNEECGILEWVNNTECLRSLINKSHSYSPDLYPNLPYKNIYTNIIELQILLVAFGTLGVLDNVELKKVKLLISFGSLVINTMFSHEILKLLSHFFRYLNSNQLNDIVSNLLKYVFTKYFFYVS